MGAMVVCRSICYPVPAAGKLALQSARCGIAWAPRQTRSARTVHIVPCNRLRCAVLPALRVPRSQMATDSSAQGKAMAQVPDARSRVKAVIANSTAESAWDQLWKEGVTPWDMGGVTPVIQDLVDKGELPDGRALVPGCGAGYDVLALASENRHVVGLDISETVNKVALKKAAENSKGQWVEFLLADFFDYTPEGPFNLIFDYTFFCAIDPALRPAFAAKMADLLTQDGELITLMFPLGEFSGGPPFAVSVESYEEVLNPHGFTMTCCKDNELAVGPRKSWDMDGNGGRCRLDKKINPLKGGKVMKIVRMYPNFCRGLKKLLAGLGKE